MSDSLTGRRGPSYGASPYGGDGSSANLADILERVLDKGVVIAGDIQINLLDIELLTIKLRLLVASVDKAKEMGIDWWEHDPSLSSRAHAPVPIMDAHPPATGTNRLAEENARLRAELAELRAAVDPPKGARQGVAQGEDTLRAAHGEER
ncbi:gas vesicle protein [Streptomyces sp. NPDC020742]|uniref:gas vesicle protein n=1 Tax=unclassified Streptomyces TaxID=2593676 RepID=UPI0033E698D7